MAVNAGEWDGEKGAHRNDFTPPGPPVDEFRFGTTYRSVAPIQPPKLTIQFIGGEKVRVNWPPAASGFVLQETETLTSPAWGPAPVGNPVDIQMGIKARRYFRLIQQ